MTLSHYFCAIVVSAIAHTSLAADRVALVIGNDAYQHARKLNAAVNDARAVGAALRQLDFNVINVSNAGVENMLEALAKLKHEAQGADAVLVYYAGHGIESNGVNYLVPVDAKLEREIQLKTQTISLDGVLEELKQLRVPARIVILDCCRDNPLEGRSWLATRSTGGGLAALPQESLSEATLVVYSASPGKPALDRVESTDIHSPFTTALLDQLPKQGVHSFEMFGMVEDGVIERTQGRQAPRIFYNGSTQPFRNFRFAAAVGSSQPPAQAPMSQPTQAAQGNPLPSLAASPSLPERGYFTISEMLLDGPYAAYNSYSQTFILKTAQEKLKAEGHYFGTLDGIAGPGTQRALIQWQQARGVTVTGRLDSETLQRLGIADIQQRTPPAAQPRPVQSSGEARRSSRKPKIVTTPSGNTLDVSDFPSGTKVRHPSTGEVIFVP